MKSNQALSGYSHDKPAEDCGTCEGASASWSVCDNCKGLGSKWLQAAPTIEPADKEETKDVKLCVRLYEENVILYLADAGKASPRKAQ